MQVSEKPYSVSELLIEGDEASQGAKANKTTQTPGGPDEEVVEVWKQMALILDRLCLFLHCFFMTTTIVRFYCL